MPKIRREETSIAEVPVGRREFLQKAAQAGLIAPAVATFSMSGLMARPAAAKSNLS